MTALRIILVEDHVLVRQGTRELLERHPGLQVVGEAGDGEQAIRLVDQHRPDVVLMDISLPGMNGIEATRQIKARHPATAVLVLTAYDDDQYVFALLEAGAAGYLLKDVSADELARAVQAVQAGESVLHPAIARKVVDYFSRRRGGGGPDALEALTAREMDVLRLAARGMTNREIADRLFISVRTVQVHLSHIFAKMEVGSRTEAVLRALQQGWLTIEDTT